MNVADGDFVLPVDKPAGPTSHDIVAMARRGLRTRRVGHTGTLDPFATGVLVLCVGRATRIAEFITGLDKRYRATALLGVETDTLDPEGQPVGPAGDVSRLSLEDVSASLARFQGAQPQLPPAYSAKKVDGVRAHRRARQGETVELEPVAIEVFEIALVDFEPPLVTFDVHVSSGTFVRAIARDLGRALGCGAHLTALRRTHVGEVGLAQSVGVEELADSAAVRHAAISPLDAVSPMPHVCVDEGVAQRLRHGQRVRIDDPSADPGASCTVAVAHRQELLAVAELADGVLRPRKVFVA